MNQRTPGKASHLWNVQEPGDPYDIRRSMIAKLPDHPNKPMNEYLEMVCLLQGAEIERLSDYLTELQCKYREVDRRELDRHSYEVQIKELAEKNTAYISLKTENDRLRDFIRRQTLELEEFQKKSIISMSLEALQSKYDGVLHELGLSREKNERLEQEIAKLNYEISQWRVKWERSEQDKVGLRTQFQRQIREKVEIEVRMTMERSEERSAKLQVQIRELREYLEGKNQEIQMLNNQKDQLMREIRLLEEKNRSRGNIEQTLNEKNKEIQRLHSIISDKSAQLQQTLFSIQRTGGELKSLQEKYLILERERETLIIRVKEVEQMRLKTEALDKYEERVAMMSMEIQRLNGINNLRSKELKEANIQIDRLRIDVKKGMYERDQSKVDLQMMAAHQSRINMLTNQLDRMTLQLKNKNDQIHSLQQKIIITDSTSSQLAVLTTEKSRFQQELQASRTEFRNYKTITDSELNTLRSECHKLKYELEQQMSSRGQTEKYRLECERIRVELERIRNQSVSFRRTLEEEKNNSLRINNQRNKLLEQRNKLIDQRNRLFEDNKRLGSQLVQLRKDIEQLRVFTREYEEKEDVIRKLRLELESTQSRNSQLDDTVQNIYKQIERLHSVLSTKTNELMRLTKDYTQIQQKCRYLQNKLNNSGGEKEYYEKQISKYKSQLDIMKFELERKNTDFITERERYEKLIIQKDKLIAEHIKEKEALERKIVELQRDIAKKSPYEEEFEKARDQLRIKETLILQLEKVIKEKDTFYKESDGRIRHYEIKIIQWEARLKEAEKLMGSKDDEIDRLNQQLLRLKELNLKVKRQNDVQYKEKLDSLTEQNFRLKKRLEQFQKGRYTEDSLRNQLLRAEEAIKFQRNEKENTRLQLVRLEQLINRQTKELQTLRENAKEHQMKIVHIENTNTKVLQDRLRDYELKLQDRDGLIISLQKEIKQLEAQFGSFVDRDRTALNSLTHYQQKIGLLSLEFDRLNQVVEKKTRESRQKDRMIQNLREQLSQRTSSDNNENYKIENANLRTALSELENINSHAIAERDELFKVSHEMKVEYEENISKLRAEIQYRIEECNKFGEEISNLRNKEHSYLQKIKELEGLASRRVEDPSLRSKVAELEHLVATYTRQINEYKIETTNLQTEISQLQMMVQEHRGKGESTNRQEIISLTIKINEYVAMMKAKDEELAIWENKYTSLYSAYEELYNNYNLTKNEYEITIANVRIYESKLFKLEEDFNALSDALRAAKIEVEQYKKENYSLKVRSQGETDLYQKNLLLSKEIDRLTEISQRMQIELSDTRLRLTDNVSLNKRIEEHLGLFVVLFAEIESLRGRLANSQRECEDVRRSSLAPLRIDKSLGPRQ